VALIAVRHNIEVAHRLFESKGKCEQIHGHSMWVTLKLFGRIDDKGILVNNEDVQFEFGEVKRKFRSMLDYTYDHHLLLNAEDDWANSLFTKEGERIGELPGLRTFSGDPTTENIATWIAEWAAAAFATDTEAEVWETSVNMARSSALWP
jgi:6-pyruvoyl-tetrahydropterin synthase